MKSAQDNRLRLGKFFMGIPLLSSKVAQDRMRLSMNEQFHCLEKIFVNNGCILIGMSPQFREITFTEKEIPKYSLEIVEHKISEDTTVVFKEIENDGSRPN